MKYIKQTASLLLCLLLLLPAWHISYAEESDMERSETVYITADAEGTPTSVLSSVYLTNPHAADALKDESTLTDVKNITSTETPKLENGVWHLAANGEDVSYQGTASADALPIRMHVRYALDGAEMSAEEIAGKSGRVRVTVSYENLLKQAVEIEDAQVELYTPFTVVTMITLDDSYRRVTVENAKLMSEAGSNMVVGITFPGLAANMETDATDMLVESFSFEAKVDSFSLESVMAIAVPDLLDADDLNSMEELETFVDGMDELTDAGDQLMRGAKSLHSGMKKFTSGLSSYVGGISSLRSEVNKALAELKGTDFSKAEDLANQAADALDRFENGLDSASGSISSAKSRLSGISDLTPEQQAEVDAAISDLNDAQRELNTLSGMIDQIKGILGSVETPDVSEVESMIDQLLDGLDALAAGGYDLEDGAVSIRKGMWSLYKGLREFNNEGLQKITEETEGITTAADRKDAMLELSEAYTAYSAENVALGSVKFVFTTDSIYVPKIDPPPAIETEKEEAAEGAQEKPSEDPTVSDVFARFGDFFQKLFGR